MAEELGWGAGGFQAFQQYSQQQSLFQQTTQENALKIQEEGLTVQKADIELQQQRRIMDAINARQKSQSVEQGGSSPTGKDPTLRQVDELNSYADLYFQAGAPKEGADLAGKAATIADTHSQMVGREAEETSKKWGTVANMASQANAENWDQLKSMFSLMHPDWAGTEDTKKILQMPYSDKLRDLLLSTAMTQKEAIELKAAQARAVASSAAARQSEARASEDKAAEDNYRDLIKNRDRAGGKNLAPKSSDVKVITDLLKAEGYGDDNDLNNAARLNSKATQTAERMNELIRAGIPQSQAKMQAFAEARARGDYGGLKRTGLKPGSFERPLAMEPDPTKRKDNQYYLGAKGQIARWDAEEKAWKLPPVEQPAAGDEDDANMPDDVDASDDPADDEPAR